MDEELHGIIFTTLDTGAYSVLVTLTIVGFAAGLYTMVVIITLRLWKSVLQKIVTWNTILSFLSAFIKLIYLIFITQAFPEPNLRMLHKFCTVLKYSEAIVDTASICGHVGMLLALMFICRWVAVRGARIEYSILIGYIIASTFIMLLVPMLSYSLIVTYDVSEVYCFALNGHMKNPYQIVAAITYNLPTVLGLSFFILAHIYYKRAKKNNVGEIPAIINQYYTFLFWLSISFLSFQVPVLVFNIIQNFIVFPDRTPYLMCIYWNNLQNVSDCVIYYIYLFKNNFKFVGGIYVGHRDSRLTTPMPLQRTSSDYTRIWDTLEDDEL